MATAAGASRRCCRPRSSTRTRRSAAGALADAVAGATSPGGGAGAVTRPLDWTAGSPPSSRRPAPSCSWLDGAGRAVRGRTVPRARRAASGGSDPVGRQLDAGPRHGRLAARGRAGPARARQPRRQRHRRRRLDGARPAAVAEGPVVLVVGDLSFLHDLGALVAARLHATNLLVVLVNNDGGGIFSFLPQAANGGAGRRAAGPLRGAVRDAPRNRAAADRRGVRVQAPRRGAAATTICGPPSTRRWAARACGWSSCGRTGRATPSCTGRRPPPWRRRWPHWSVRGPRDPYPRRRRRGMSCGPVATARRSC